MQTPPSLGPKAARGEEKNRSQPFLGMLQQDKPVSRMVEKQTLGLVEESRVEDSAGGVKVELTPVGRDFWCC